MVDIGLKERILELSAARRNYQFAKTELMTPEDTEPFCRACWDTHTHCAACGQRLDEDGCCETEGCENNAHALENRAGAVESGL